MPQGLIDVMNVRPAQRLRVIVRLQPLHETEIAFEIEFQHQIGLALVQINRVRMDDRLRIILIELANHLPGIDISDGHVRIAVIPQADFVLGTSSDA